MNGRPRMGVVGAEFAIEDPWQIPAGAVPAPLLDSSDGSRPRLETTVACYADAFRLYFIFTGVDDGVVATHREHDAPLYEEDVVEIFLAPDSAARYFEIELSPAGVLFDAVIHSPRGTRELMTTDRQWNCKDLFAAVRYDHDSSAGPGTHKVSKFSSVVAVPFASLGAQAPLAGDTWLANFFRIDRHPEGDEFTAWSPTGKNPPDFHVTAAFGELRFA